MLGSSPGDRMRNFSESALFLLVFLAAARGAGAFVFKKILPDALVGHAFLTAFGLGLWIVLGGLLNLVHLALPIALDLLLLVGLAFSGISLAAWYRARVATKAAEKPILSKAEVLQKFGLPLGVTLLVAYLVSTQMPSLSLNLHDDFFLYLPRPIRMLETGSIAGNPFDAVGLDSLGGQAFLQSFFVNRLSLLHIHGFDAITCFGLSLGLILEIARQFRAQIGLILAALTAFLLIPPQIVNSSALFSASLMILGLVHATTLIAESIQQKDEPRIKAHIFLGAVFLSSLWALKNPFLVFGLFYLVFFSVHLILGHSDKSWLLKRIGAWFGLTLILLGAWLIPVLPRYRDALRGAALAALPLQDRATGQEGVLANLTMAFSWEESTWGGKILAYTLLVIFLLIVGMTSWRRSKHSEESHRPRLIASSALCLAVVLTYFGNICLFDPMNGMRYSIPLLLPAVATALLTLSLLITPNENSPAMARLGALASAMTVLLLALGFGTANQDRFEFLFRRRTLLSFPLAAAKPYRQYILASFNPPAANYIQQVQQQFDPGTAIVAWVRTPFHFDHRRNRIYNLSENSIVAPWFADFPLEAGPEDVRAYLQRLGVRYVFFEHDAPGMKTDEEFVVQRNSPYAYLRRFGARNLAFRRVLKMLSEQSQVLYQTPTTVAFDLDKPVAPGAKEAEKK